ncbi:MAG: response regulator, partial [bacterium]
MSKKIILGSSSITILKEVEWNLTETDYEIVPANDTDDFKEQMKTQKPDLFIIDRDMQEGNGVSLCKEVKTSDQYSKIPVIMLVKKEEDQKEDFITQLAKECNADKILTVPLESTKLQSTIQYLFARQSAASDPLTQTLSSPDAGAGQSPGAEAAPVETPPVADLSMESQAGEPEAAASEASPIPEAPLEEELDLEEFKIEGATPLGGEEVPSEAPPVAEPSMEQEAAPAEASPPIPEVPLEEELDLEEFKIEEVPPSMEPQAAASEASPIPEPPVNEQPKVEETPSLSAEDALQETIKVVEDAIKRNKTVPPANAQGTPAQAQPSQEKSNQEEVVQAVTAQAAAQWKPDSDVPIQEIAPVQETASKELGEDLKGTDNAGKAESWPSFSQGSSEERGFEGSNHPVMVWLKDMLNERMEPIIRQSVPEMTKKMILDQMNKIIEESVS